MGVGGGSLLMELCTKVQFSIGNEITHLYFMWRKGCFDLNKHISVLRVAYMGLEWLFWRTLCLNYRRRVGGEAKGGSYPRKKIIIKIIYL